MLDTKILRENLDAVKAMLKARHNDLDLSSFEELDHQRRGMIVESDSLKQERKSSSKQIGQILKQGGDAGEIKARVSDIGDRVKVLEQRLKDTETKLDELLVWIPNLLDPSTPNGASEADNVVVSHWGQPGTFAFEPKDHVDLGTALGILDFEIAARMTGSRFAMLKGSGARLERALINFMIQIHEEQGYTEILPPLMVNSQSMFATGQFPKMREDVFKIEGCDYYLIPTAEVPLTNIHRDEVLQEKQLPIYYQSFTPCFRSEAGSYGKDTRGLIRLHQFNKVEIVKLVHPDNSSEELEKLRADAETILQRLELPYRVMSLCSGDLSFASNKCYDLEVWLPGQQRYREISSCSNCGDFQARRMNARFKASKKGGGDKNTRFVHTLNGSGVAVGRALIAVMENYYDPKDGGVVVPEALKPYMGGVEKITK